MKSREALIGFLIVILGWTGTSKAVEWSKRLGAGIRGPVIAPMFKGSEFNYNGSFENFMMGWNISPHIKYGFNRSFVINLSGAYNITYDDTTAASDQTFKLNKADNASVKMTGIRFSLEGQYYFLTQGNVQPYLLAGLGIDMWTLERQTTGTTYSFKDLGGKVGAGINFWLGDRFSLDLQGKLTYDLASISADDLPGYYGAVDWTDFKTRPFGGYLEPSIGLTYFITGTPDSDKDGISDKFDQCPDTPKGALVDEYGCPRDSDGDTVFDGIDACDNTPAGAFVDIIGCPLDTDQDGVYDGIDQCPDTPLDVTVDERGCPLDTDGDGVPDFKDQEMNSPRGAIVDENGIALDGDRDGVADGIDKCPETAEGVQVDELGCPKAKPLVEKIILNIQYAAGSFQPDAPARKILDDVVESMNAYPNLKIEVNGYTDALGSARGNLKLSTKRAEAVMLYIRDKGIAADRMTVHGYGEDPKYFIGDNATPEGRQKNRRVEIEPVPQQ